MDAWLIPNLSHPSFLCAFQVPVLGHHGWPEPRDLVAETKARAWDVNGSGRVNKALRRALCRVRTQDIIRPTCCPMKTLARVAKIALADLPACPSWIKFGNMSAALIVYQVRAREENEHDALEVAAPGTGPSLEVSAFEPHVPFTLNIVIFSPFANAFSTCTHGGAQNTRVL